MEFIASIINISTKEEKKKDVKTLEKNPPKICCCPSSFDFPPRLLNSP